MAPRSLPALLLLGLLAGGLTAGAPPDGPSPTTETYDRVVRPVLAEHGCTAAAFDQVEGERSALIRTPDGRIRIVSLARGRAVYAGRRPGVLMGLCTR
jgi:hypothetical protein